MSQKVGEQNSMYNSVNEWLGGTELSRLLEARPSV